MGIITLLILSTLLLEIDVKAMMAINEDVHLHIDNYFSINVPQDFSFNEPKNDYYYYGYKKDESRDIAYISFHSNSKYSCSSEAIGSKELSNMESIGDKAIWAKMTLTTAHNHYPETYCNLFSIECTEGDISDGNCKTTESVYSFCTEKSGKKVAICLKQNTDNPRQAKEIFESFQWLDEEDIFHDIPSSYLQSTAISYVKERGIVEGYEDNTYRPGQPINRAEFTKIIVGAAGISTERLCRIAPFPDAPISEWYGNYVQAARCTNIVGGYPDGTFRPADNVNAAEAFKIVVGAFDLPFLEEEGGSAWYEQYWSTLEAMDAIPSSVTNPSHLLTRGEMAEVIYKVMMHIDSQ